MAGSPPQQPPPYRTIAPMQTVQVVMSQPLGPRPQMTTCPNCRRLIVTRVYHEISLKTHLCAIALCLILCWPCICVPYCFNVCKSTVHYCPNCGIFLGVYDC